MGLENQTKLSGKFPATLFLNTEHQVFMIDFFDKWYILVYINIMRRGQAMESIAKIFQNGRSQAVRLPKAFRFKGNEVKISKNGDKVILEPLERNRWPEGFWDAFPVDLDFKTPEALPSKNLSLD